MEEYVLSYYNEFKCIAQNCKHTCCAGWQMCIDEQCLNSYKNEKTAFVSTLKKGINFKKSKFKWRNNRRCFFLNDKGLCEIIINLGKQRLCQVCSDHPRFRSFFANRTETGLGFCCEEVTRIILSYQGKIEPVLVDKDEKECELSFNEKNILDFRCKALDIVQHRAVDINERIYQLLSICKADNSSWDVKKIIKAFLSFERLDKGWTARLKGIKKERFVTAVDQSLSLQCEQFLSNSLFRHLSSAEDTMWVRARTIGVVISWWIIQNIYQGSENQNFETLVDIVRSYSAEVEYSQKNLDKLFCFSYPLIKV